MISARVVLLFEDIPVTQRLIPEFNARTLVDLKQAVPDTRSNLQQCVSIPNSSLALPISLTGAPLTTNGAWSCNSSLKSVGLMSA